MHFIGDAGVRAPSDKTFLPCGRDVVVQDYKVGIGFYSTWNYTSVRLLLQYLPPPVGFVEYLGILHHAQVCTEGKLIEFRDNR
jgi:hypothetical protein